MSGEEAKIKAKVGSLITADRNWQNFDNIFHGWDPYMIIRLSMILGAINKQ